MSDLNPKMRWNLVLREVTFNFKAAVIANFIFLKFEIFYKSVCDLADAAVKSENKIVDLLLFVAWLGLIDFDITMCAVFYLKP